MDGSLGRKSQRPFILVGHEDGEQRRLLAEWLLVEGYSVIEAVDGAEALQKAESGLFDLVLMAIHLPRRTGSSICRALKSRLETCLLPVVLIADIENNDEIGLVLESSADDFVDKSICRRELLARVRFLLRTRSNARELEGVESVLCSLALGIEANDPYTASHSQRVSRDAMAFARMLDGHIAGSATGLGRRLRLTPDQITLLHRAGMMHDLGKIGIPSEILRKEGRFTPEERSIMKQHPVIGAKICSRLKAFHSALPIIRHHHEHLDGSGYPDGLKGDKIPLLARIVSTVDVFDALTSGRTYRDPLSTDQALEVMRDEVKCGWWDGEIVEEFAGFLKDESDNNRVDVGIGVGLHGS